MRDDALAGRLTDEGHVLRQRVYFEDTDFSGLVFHARYLHFMERGRSDFLRLLGIHHFELARDGLAFAVRRMNLDFLRAGRIDDVVDVVTIPKETGGARLVLGQSVLRGEETLVEAEVTVVLINADGRAVRMPRAIRDALGQGSRQAGG